MHAEEPVSTPGLRISVLMLIPETSDLAHEPLTSSLQESLHLNGCLDRAETIALWTVFGLYRSSKH